MAAPNETAMKQGNDQSVGLLHTTGGILREAGLILLTAVAIGILVNQFRSHWRTAPLPPPVAVSDSAVLSGPKMIDLDTAVQWFENASAIFIDARDRYDFAANHVPGAIHLNVQETDIWMMDIYRSLPQDGWIIAYGDNVADENARLLAERLTEMGFRNVYYLASGWQGWMARGLPVNDAIGTRSVFE